MRNDVEFYRNIQDSFQAVVYYKFVIPLLALALRIAYLEGV